jgi:type II secretory pathway component GspD/PulD (secretin)
MPNLLGGKAGASPAALPSGPMVALQSGPDHARTVCHLQWLPATDVRTTINELLRQEAELPGAAATTAKSGLSMRVAIVNEPITNSLVVSGPPEAVEEVRKLAEDLDRPQPGVQLDVELGEVSAGEAKHGESLKGEGGTPSAETSRTFYVLERPKNMTTISRARVFALDNQTANIQLGQRVATVASVNRMGGFGGGAAAQRSYSYTFQNVGTLVGVTPRINVNEGIIVMQVDAEDSHILPEKAGDADADKDFRPTETGSLTLQTTVAVSDSKTIMIGSIGRQGKDDKELVIVLTPHILRSEDVKKTGR